jgi:TetR/AcrR family transcriptional regulator, lmrAB and yxaGH operons repressor
MSTQGEQTRQKIIDTVIELLKVKGFAGVGLQEIIKESGAPKGSLYFHFPGGKNEIVEAALKQHLENMDALFRAVFLEGNDMATAMGVVITYMMGELESSSYAKGCPVATTTLDRASISDSIQESCAQCFSSMRAVIAEKLTRDGIAPAEAEKQALFILSSLEGAIVLSKAYRDTGPLKVVLERLAALYTSK